MPDPAVTVVAATLRDRVGVATDAPFSGDPTRRNGFTMTDPLAHLRSPVPEPDVPAFGTDMRLAVCDAVRWLCTQPALNLFGPYSITAGWETDPDSRDGSILPSVGLQGREEDMRGILAVYGMTPLSESEAFARYRARIEVADLPGVPVVTLFAAVDR